MAIIDKPIRHIPTPHGDWLLKCDALNLAFGSELPQDGKTISMISKLFNKHQKYKSAPELEACAIANSVDSFRPYLLGKFFNVQKECKVLEWINIRDNSSKNSQTGH